MELRNVSKEWVVLQLIIVDSLFLLFSIIDVCHASSNYSLHLSNTSPAVVYSNVTFTAQLIASNDTDTNYTVYKYYWEDNAFILHHTATIYSNDTCVLSHMYKTLNLNPLNHTLVMTVKVYRKINESEPTWEDNEELIATGNNPFYFTDALNLAVHWIGSDNSSRNIPSIYATKSNLTLDVTTLDTFSNVTFIYTWCKSKYECYNTSNPTWTTMFSKPGTYSLTVNVTAYVVYNDTIFIPFIQNVTLKGTYQSNMILVEDKITRISVSGERTIYRDDTLYAYVSCYGSGPFNTTWNITDPDGRVITRANKSTEYCYIPIRQSLNVSAIYNLSVILNNGVSVGHASVSIDVKEKVTPTSIFVPVFSGILATFLITLILFTYYREKQLSSRHEIADFDFRHYLSDTKSFFTKLKEKFTGVVSKIKQPGHNQNEDHLELEESSFSERSHLTASQRSRNRSHNSLNTLDNYML